MALIFIVLTVVFSILFYFSMLFMTFIIGGAVILIAERMINDYRKRIKKYGIQGRWVKFLGYFLIFFWMFVILFALGSSIVEFGEVVDIASKKHDSFSKYYEMEIEPLLPEIATEWIINEDFIRYVEESIIYYLSVIISNLSVLIFNSILIIPLMVYMYFKRGKEIGNHIYQLIPGGYHDSFFKTLKDIGKYLHDFFEAKAIESLVIAAICCFGFYVAGLQGWLILGVLAGILNIIPYLGPIIGALPPILVAFIDQPVVALYVIITIIIAQLVDNFYLIPFMITKKVSIHPLVGIVIIFASAQLFGIMGMVFGIPIYLVYKIILTEAYRNLVKIYE